jgi:hypothetical protein
MLVLFVVAAFVIVEEVFEEEREDETGRGTIAGTVGGLVLVLPLFDVCCDCACDGGCGTGVTSIEGIEGSPPLLLVATEVLAMILPRLPYRIALIASPS